MDDQAFMARALRLAAAGTGSTYPNPCVGAVVGKRGKVLAAFRSAATGGPHAEVRALNKAGSAARGATLYVTLEPCCHVGRTGPCTTAIIEAGIKRVVVGVRDPATHAAGKGIRRLRRAGLEVVTEGWEVAATAVHEHYLHQQLTGRPFVTLKSAASLDGRIAMPGGDSKWITGLAARRYGHRLRAKHHAIAVGVETVLADDPALDVRLVRGVSPIRVIFDSQLRLGKPDVPIRRALAPGVLVFHTDRASKRRRRKLVDQGVELVTVAADRNGRVDLVEAVTRLGERSVRSLLVEGGGRLLGGWFSRGLWQRMYLFHAPRILGEGRPMVGGVSWDKVADAPAVRIEKRQVVGDDFLSIVVPA